MCTNTFMKSSDTPLRNRIRVERRVEQLGRTRVETRIVARAITARHVIQSISVTVTPLGIWKSVTVSNRLFIVSVTHEVQGQTKPR